MADCCVRAGNLEWHGLTVISVVNALMMTVMIMNESFLLPMMIMMIVMGVMNHHWWWWWWWAIEKALTQVQSLTLPPKTIPNTTTTCRYCFFTSSLLKCYTWNHNVFHCHQFINPSFEGFKTFGRNWAADVWFGRASHNTNGFSHTRSHTCHLHIAQFKPGSLCNAHDW